MDGSSFFNRSLLERLTALLANFESNGMILIYLLLNKLKLDMIFSILEEPKTT